MEVETVPASQVVEVPVPTEVPTQQTTGDTQQEAKASPTEVGENLFLPEAYKKQLEEMPKAEPVAEVKKEEPAPLPDVVDITTEEKLQSTRIELSFLKTRQQIEQLNQMAENIQRGYPQFIANLVKKYKVDMNFYTYDAVEAKFTRKK